MNLQPITGTPFYFTCYKCGRQAQSTGLPMHRNEPYCGPSMADLDGPAFQAYYCGECAASMKPEVEP